MATMVAQIIPWNTVVIILRRLSVLIAVSTGPGYGRCTTAAML